MSVAPLTVVAKNVPGAVVAGLKSKVRVGPELWNTDRTVPLEARDTPVTSVMPASAIVSCGPNPVMVPLTAAGSANVSRPVSAVPLKAMVCDDATVPPNDQVPPF